MNGPPRDFQRLEQLVHETLALPVERRQVYLDSACADDHDLKRDVEALLSHEDGANQRFAGSPLDLTTLERLTESTAPPDEAIDRRIGSYRLVEKIGAGGMGNVYRAVRDDAEFDQTVAIKLIKRGLDTDEIVHRFRHERQVLAGLEHANIARLIDGGVTDDERPYLVMEYIVGIPIDEYCDGQRLTIDRRVELFMTLCDAVQYAHQNLVIHRDLKPNNVLITERGELKLLDFGIARVLSPDDNAGTIDVTQPDDRRLTPAYAAPEQIRGEPTSTSVDVYALGVILYELLTGCRPYQLTGTSREQDTRMICETDPMPPSRRLDATGPARDESLDVQTIAGARRLDPARLRRRLRGDLDTIVLTALRKEASRRYASVEALREDLRRYRQGLPIAARSDTWSYRTARFLKRHRLPAAAVSAAVILLVTGTIVSTTLAVRLSDRTEELGSALGDRQKALDEANTRRAEVEREFRRARSSVSVLISTLQALANENETVRHRMVEQIQQRSKRLDNSTVPLTVEAELATRQALAMLARTIGAHEPALAQNRRIIALATDRPEEARTLREAWAQIGWLHLQLDEPHDAIDALRTAETIDDPTNDDELERADLLLMEALLLTDRPDEARRVLKSKTFPAPPIDRFLRQSIEELEDRFSVILLSEPVD